MKIAVIGCGVMGSAFARHLAKKHKVILCSRTPEKAEALARETGGQWLMSPADAVCEAEAVLLTVKPGDLAAVAKELTPGLKKGTLLLSALAGTPTGVLKALFPAAVVVRTMPNLGLLCGQGVVGVVSDGSLKEEEQLKVQLLLEGVGLIMWMAEDKIEAVTALSGSGIAFVLVMIEAMIDGGVSLGFPSATARDLVLKTFEGAVTLIRESGKHPAELKLQIASPAGTTMAGLKVMEEKGVRSGIIQTLVASHEKALNMKKAQENSSA
jgi:pyrroline-5-carboxylate reductase